MGQIFRNYPQEFSIFYELFIAFVTVYSVNWFFESQDTLNYLSKLHINATDGCLFGIIDINFLGDIIRGYSFILTLFIISVRSTPEFPLPFTWIFRDLQKFIFDPYSVKIFRNYLATKEKDMLIYLDEIMKMVIEGDKFILP